MKKNKQSCRHLWNTIKITNICKREPQRGGEEEAEEIFYRTNGWKLSKYEGKTLIYTFKKVNKVQVG